MVTSQGSKPARKKAAAISRSPLVPSSRRMATLGLCPALSTLSGVRVGSKLRWSRRPVPLCVARRSASAHSGLDCSLSNWKEVSCQTSLRAGMSSERTELPAAPDGDLPVSRGVADGVAVGLDAMFFEDAPDGRLVPGEILDHQPGLFAEEVVKNVRAGELRVLDPHIEAAVAGEGHLQQAGDQSAIGPVMAGQDEALPVQGLDSFETRPEQPGIVYVRGFVAHLIEDLRQGGAADAASPSGEVDEHQPAGAGLLDVGGDGPGDVRAGGVGGDYQRARGLDQATFRPPGPPWRPCSWSPCRR